MVRVQTYPVPEPRTYAPGEEIRPTYTLGMLFRLVTVFCSDHESIVFCQASWCLWWMTPFLTTVGICCWAPLWLDGYGRETDIFFLSYCPCILITEPHKWNECLWESRFVNFSLVVVHDTGISSHEQTDTERINFFPCLLNTTYLPGGLSVHVARAITLYDRGHSAGTGDWLPPQELLWPRTVGCEGSKCSRNSGDSLPMNTALYSSRRNSSPSTAKLRLQEVNRFNARLFLS